MTSHFPSSSKTRDKKCMLHIKTVNWSELVTAHSVAKFHSNMSWGEKSKWAKGTGRVARMGETVNNEYKFSLIIVTEESNLKTLIYVGVWLKRVL
jgi:hypothetical protein